MQESNLKLDRSDWARYYDAQSGRPVRPLLVQTLEAQAGVRVGTAIDRLTFTQVAFEQLVALPPADLIHSGFALPFCAAVRFPTLWAHVRSALLPGGFLAVELFGPHDEWAGRADMNFHDRAQIDALLSGFTVHHLVEEDRPGASPFGPKHWHVFHLIARRPFL